MTHVTTINTGAFERLATFFEDNPEQHDQETWFIPARTLCNSTGCLAGWACVHESEDFEIVKDHEFEGYVPTAKVMEEWGIADAVPPLRRMTELSRTVVDEGTWTRSYFFQRGMEVLGLTTIQASHLFEMDHGPLNGLTVSEALHKIAMGTDITEVWGDPTSDCP